MQESMLTIFDNVNTRIVDDLRAKLYNISYGVFKPRYSF